MGVGVGGNQPLYALSLPVPHSREHLELVLNQEYLAGVEAIRGVK